MKSAQIDFSLQIHFLKVLSIVAQNRSKWISTFPPQVDKVVAVAEDIKMIGNNLFKSQDWNAAVNKYSKALRFKSHY